MGTTLDEGDGRPVSNAVVRLVDSEGETAVETLSDELGRFRVTPPEAGAYTLTAERIGYRFAQTPLLDLDTGGMVALELTMMPAPIGLEGLEVEVDVAAEAAEELRLAGVEPRSLGQRWISRADIEAVEIRSDVGRLLEWQQIPSLRVIRSENASPLGDDMGMCLSLLRARTGAGMGRCALGVVDGRAVTNEELQFVDPETVEAMAVLQPIEATVLFGVRGEAGALVIWTRRGGD